MARKQAVFRGDAVQSDPNDHDILTYDATVNEWLPAPEGALLTQDMFEHTDIERQEHFSHDDTISYESVDEIFVHKYVPKKIDDLDNVETGTPTDEQHLTYNATDNFWVSSEPYSRIKRLRELFGVSVEDAVDGRFLQYSNNKWRARSDYVAKHNLGNHTNVDTFIKWDGVPLTYDTFNGIWMVRDDECSVDADSETDHLYFSKHGSTWGCFTDATDWRPLQRQREGTLDIYSHGLHEPGLYEFVNVQIPRVWPQYGKHPDIHSTSTNNIEADRIYSFGDIGIIGAIYNGDTVTFTCRVPEDQDVPRDFLTIYESCTPVPLEYGQEQLAFTEWKDESYPGTKTITAIYHITDYTGSGGGWTTGAGFKSSVPLSHMSFYDFTDGF